MIIGERLQAIRAEKNLSQGDIEKRTDLLHCYISRVENGHTVPAIETLEKTARALEVPLYQLFYDGDEPPTLAKILSCRQQMTVIGAVLGKMRGSWRCSADSSVAWTSPTDDCFFH